MSRKLVVIISILLLVMTAPAMAMLKVLEPQLVEELQGIAKVYLAESRQVAPEAVTVEDGWVREFWNMGVDVYMAEAVINSGLPSEQKVQVPVRVDQKAVLTAEDLKALEEEDQRLAPSEPQARILKASAESVPAITAAPVDAEQPAANYTNYYIAGAALLVVLAGMTVLFVRRRAC